MNKRQFFITIFIFLFLIGGFTLYKYKGFSFFRKQNLYTPSTYGDTMSGTVATTTFESIFVDGQVKTYDGKTIRKVVEFIINSNTALNKTEITSTAEQIKSGKQFTPKIDRGPGYFSDLKQGAQITNIKSNLNLVDHSKVFATQVDYLIQNLPTIQTTNEKK